MAAATTTAMVSFDPAPILCLLLRHRRPGGPGSTNLGVDDERPGELDLVGARNGGVATLPIGMAIGQVPQGGVGGRAAPADHIGDEVGSPGLGEHQVPTFDVGVAADKSRGAALVQLETKPPVPYHPHPGAVPLLV